ncbi:phosphoribosylanthranilate isomerase [Agathobaculum sp. NTUH-O15-33]|uniref:phosphoribosylanthranilate isomerase n=1 Tax=Agathobaculum sp. NTUH-O15-33 TaxID=3079302 RepID=UPI002958D90A|nr:phosphoribosylanthranilate isomerase [Agathobaculum sp. NTUH-O15-33]WNX85886.1 phosphoribosylanthranilate isomerase [Agathobaculum sp. NTUH-O15-33]
MKLKFCGLTREADIEAANETGPDYIGFVFAESRRRVSDLDAARFKARLDPAIQAVGVFVNDTPEHIAALAGEGIIAFAQLHGDEDARVIERLRRLTDVPLIKAVRVKTRADIERALALPVDYLLLDTYVGHAYGGSGKAFDWSLIGDIPKPYFLAGGLRAENLEQALQTGAYALDLSSGIETNGVKDPAKMRAVAERVRSGRP